MAGHEFLRGPTPRVRSLPAHREGFTGGQNRKDNERKINL